MSKGTTNPPPINLNENQADVQVEDLTPSELGTKEYWDESYKDELSNFKSSGNVGDIWFGEDIMYKVVNYLSDCHKITEDSSIVDLGCGNGVMLLELAREGFKNLTGLDYSESAIELSKTLMSSNEYDAVFKVVNLLEEGGQSGAETEKFDVCLDKGTFDAISLCPDIPQEEARAKYFSNVVNLLKNEDSLFILTSCNWTTPELISLSTAYLKVLEVIPTPTFMFGGKAGNVVTFIITLRHCPEIWGDWVTSITDDDFKFPNRWYRICGMHINPKVFDLITNTWWQHLKYYVMVLSAVEFLSYAMGIRLKGNRLFYF